MKMTRLISSAIPAVFFSAMMLVAGSMTGCKGSAAAKDKPAPIVITDFPAPVQATIKKESDGAVLGSLDKDTIDGKTVYTADLTKGDAKSEVTVAEDGKLLEHADIIPLAQAPAGVLATLTKEGKGGKAGKNISKATKDGKDIYTGSVKVGKKKTIYQMDEKGKVLSKL